MPDAPVESKAYKRKIRYLPIPTCFLTIFFRYFIPYYFIMPFCRPGFDGKNPGTPAYTYEVIPKGTYAGDRPFNGFETVRGP